MTSPFFCGEGQGAFGLECRCRVASGQSVFVGRELLGSSAAAASLAAFFPFSTSDLLALRRELLLQWCAAARRATLALLLGLLQVFLFSNQSCQWSGFKRLLQ